MWDDFLRSLALVLALNMNFAYADIDLVQCIGFAIQKNAEIKKARAEFYALKESEDQSLANLLPSIGISVSRSKVAQDRSDGSGLELNQNYVMESDSISLRQPVYRPKLLKDLKRTRLEISAEKFSLSSKEDMVKMKVAESYFSLLRAYAEEGLLEKRTILLIQQKKAAEKSLSAGRGTVTELAEINAATDRVSADLIKAKQNVRLALNELEFFTGEKVSRVYTLKNGVDNFSVFNRETVDYWEDEAVSNNLNLRSREARISAARLALSSEKLARYPTVDLNIQMSRGSSESTFFVDSETRSNSIGLTAFMPIYQGGGVSSKIRQLAFRLDAEVEGLKLEEDELRKRVQKIYFGLKESIELSAALKSAIKSSLIELESTKKSTVAGIRKQLDVLVSQQKSLSVEREFIEAKLNIILYWLNLNMLTSNLSSETLKTVNNLLDSN